MPELGGRELKRFTTSRPLHTFVVFYSDWPPSWGLSWGRYIQRRCYLCNVRASSSIGVEVAIGSAATISKVAISNGHCTSFCWVTYILGCALVLQASTHHFFEKNRIKLRQWPDLVSTVAHIQMPQSASRKEKLELKVLVVLILTNRFRIFLCLP